MESSNRSYPQSRDSDADIGLLLYKTGHAIKQFFIWIGQMLGVVLSIIGAPLLFILKNLHWLLVGALIGLVYGYFNYKRQGPQYTAQMTVKANFGSQRALYNTFDYLNALISSSNHQELARIFGITPKEAEELLEFSGSFVESEIITADMYKEQFMDHNRADRVRQDTFWVRTISYEGFKESLTKFDYPYHEVQVRSKNPAIFPNLQAGLINYVSKNELLQEVRNKQSISNKDEEALLTQAIGNLDTLRRAYNLRLARGGTTSNPSGNQLTLLEAMPDMKTPELDLYDKLLELHDQLKNSRKRTSMEEEILEVLSPFNPVGRQLTFLKQNGITDIITGLAISFLVLLAIGIYRMKVPGSPKHRVVDSSNPVV